MKAIRKVNWFLILLVAIVVIVAYFISRWAHLNYWLILVIVAVAILLNGLLASWEDNQPGGFNNPK